MKSQQFLIAILIFATACHLAAAQDKKKRIQVEEPPLERVLSATNYAQSNAVLSDLVAIKPEMPLGPQDVLKSYEIAMSLVTEKTSSNFLAIVQAQRANQIAREQAEYLLQQEYQMAMMQYQVLSALHDVLKHDIDEANQGSRRVLNPGNSNTALVVPWAGAPAGAGSQ